MKKIYMILAAMMLLSMSLNAQTMATKHVQSVDKSKDVGKAIDGKVRDLLSGIKAAPADAVSAPYYNTLNTTDERGQTGTYDANGDGTTGSNSGKWGYFYADDTQTDIHARYIYHSSNAANDYFFIGVPVTLLPGKTYTFSMDVITGGYTEKYEVVMFDELTTTSIAAATQIIPVTTTSSTTTTRIQSQPFSVTTESYMYFAIHCVSDADQYYLGIDNIAIEPDNSDDLSAGISAPEAVYAGETATVTATVANNGSSAVQGYTVRFTADGTVISTQTGSSLAAGASTTYTAQYATTSANAGQIIKLGVEVVYTDDDASNNSASASMYVKPVAPPENVVATPGDNQNATVTWEAPIIAPVPTTYVWDFEEQSDLAEFTRVDSDGDGYNWSWHYNSGSGNYTVHEGYGIAYSESFHNNDDGQTGVALSPDNWMISPEVTLGGTLTLWAAHQASYPENFAVYVCAGPYSGVSSFTKVYGDITTTGSMVKHTIDLSAYQGQGYIAIRHYNVSDQFILLIDDISCLRMAPGEQPISYNVYLDGVFVANVNANTFSHDFSNLAIGNHQCAISAVYPGGIESAQVPADFTIASSTPELITPVDNSTVNVGTHDGLGTSTTITVAGMNLTEDLTVTVSGNGFSVSPATISAADANSGTATVTVTYNGTETNATGTLTIGSSEVSATVNLTAGYVPPTPIGEGDLLRLHLLMVDQFKEEIPDDNKHPDAYGYILRYEPEVGEHKQSAQVDVEIEKTKAKVNGFYTLSQINNDTNADTALLTLNVLNAQVRMELDDDNPDILYFQMQGMENGYPTSDDPYLTKLQYVKNIHMYKEMEQSSPDFGKPYDPAETHYYYNTVDTIIGSYRNDDFVTYAPSVSTWGVQRRYFEEDDKDNTYGAPIWKTAVGAVEISGSPTIQKQVVNAGTSQEENNPYTTWTVGEKTYCLYFLGASAQGYLPKPSITNINYEPYMFRVFVSSPSGKLRKYDKVLGQGGGYVAVDAGPVTGKYCVGSYDISSGTWNENELFFNKGISNVKPTSDNPGWDGNMIFGAEDGITKNDIEVYVRFYYMVEGWGAKAAGEARPGNGAESDPGTPDNPSTFIYEYEINAEVVGVTYVNAQGMQSDKPFDGLNIIVTRYSDGTTSTSKVFK